MVTRPPLMKTALPAPVSITPPKLGPAIDYQENLPKMDIETAVDHAFLSVEGALARDFEVPPEKESPKDKLPEADSVKDTSDKEPDNEKQEVLVSEMTSLIEKREEGFVRESKVSIPFGVIGVGQGGGKIADSFAACRIPGRTTANYQAIAINTCIADLQALKNIPVNRRIALPNYELGASRQPIKGYEAITQPGVLENVVEQVKTVFSGLTYIIITGGVGGGTATGILQVLAEALVEVGFTVILMVTLPRDVDSTEEKMNANAFLEPFQEMLDTGSIASSIPVDNNLLYNRYLEHTKDSDNDIDWKTDSNTEIVQIFNEMNALTGLASDTTFDGAELTKILSSGGCVAFGKAIIDLPDEALSQTIALRIQEILHKGYLANYENLTETRYAGVQIIVPENLEFGAKLEKAIREEIKKHMPNLLGIYIGYAHVAENTDKCLVYTVASGMGLPTQAYEIGKSLQAEIEKINAAESKRMQFKPVEVNLLQSPFQKRQEKRTVNPFMKQPVKG